ncbi:MAG TPA: TIGR03000 domain-containing protein [Urbifossiella sp.]|jgi:uncharacterized protein (TIGR03000 family)|nr:TIGR03000 domain-containing protein [Urbifossiella sp.]
MRKILFAAVIALAGYATPARAWLTDLPTSTSATFPLLTPSGYYTNTYYYGWAYPWYSHYNYAHGTYANWRAGGGYATYGYGWPNYAPTNPLAGTAAGTLVVTLPVDATLTFNGVVATGTGVTRTFSVPALSYGQDFGYVLVAELVEGGKTTRASARVVLRAGETARVALDPK